MKAALKHLEIIVVGVALLLALAGCGGGGEDEGESRATPPPDQSPGMDTEPDQTTLVTLFGIVLDQSSPGMVIPGATIRVTQYSDGVSQVLDTITTTDNGHYETAVNAALGRMNISVEAEDYAPQSVIVNLAEGQTTVAANLAMVPIPVDR